MVQEASDPTRGVDSYPLSPLQQGMLFHSLQAGSSGVDVEQIVCELHEEINAAHFERAWREVIDRHAIFRTSFEWQSGSEPRQVVHAPSRVHLRFHHEEFGCAREAHHGLEDYLAADRREGFPSLAAPLLRIALLRGGAKRYWFVTTFHHLILDGRALVVMFKEVMDTHDALVQGRPIELPPAPSYRSYIDWLRTLDEAKAGQFWRAQLKGFSAPTLLPIGRAAAATDSVIDARGELAFRLTEKTTEQLRAVAKQHDVTINTLVQAAWALVLSRYTGEDDVVFGAVRACRHIPVEGAGSTVGLFINTVPVRVRVPADASIASWLQQVRNTWVAVRDYEHTPLMKAQQCSDVAPGQPLFETLFNYQEPSWDAALRALGGAWERREWDIRSQPNYPVAVDAYGGPAVMIKMLYDRRRFADDAINRLLGHYRVVLEALAAGAHQVVGEIPLLTEQEREQTLVVWNRTETEYPRDHCAHSLVEARAGHAPASLAVADAAATLTYGELNRRANQLAHRLKKHGVGPETLVPVCMERSAEMMVAWLAVLKAGGAFVPLDPSYPAERLAFQLEDCGAAVCLTQPKVRAGLPTLAREVIVVEVAPGGSGFEDEPDGNLPPSSDARNLAYVIYTSGSTGQPKGVQIEHRSLMNLIAWHQRTYAVTPADRATHLASPAFDASVWEIWPYLTAGASVHIPDEETRIAPALLWQWLAAERISLAFIPTPLAEAMLNEAAPQKMALRAILTGGDKLKRRPPQDFPCALINHYGPTENTVVATCAPVERAGDSVAPSIGRPIANTRVYVLDSHGRPVPAGVIGELFIGGESLARGYHHRPDLTAEKFVSRRSLPQAKCHLLNDTLREEVLYRTGDLVRWTADGQLEFVGRIDNQVKVRGHRIELGEIEAALQRHPAARESLVLARTDARGQTRLVAYVLALSAATPAQCNVIRYNGPERVSGESNVIRYFGGGATPAEADLIEFLRAKLPAYMVPASIVFLDAWPLTPNGKIDRAALPAPDAAAPANGSFAAPRTAIEQTVARIWSDVLGQSPIGLNDNFFELGGHSLLAAQVISRLNAAFPARLTVRTLFDQPTLAGTAREIELRLQATAAPTPPLRRLKRRTPRTDMELVPPN